MHSVATVMHSQLKCLLKYNLGPPNIYDTISALHCMNLFAILSTFEIYEVTRLEVPVVVKIPITEEHASIFRIPEDASSNIPRK